MADLNKMKEHLTNAEREIKEAMEALTPINSLKQIEALLLGHFKSALVVLEQAHGAVEQVIAYKSNQPKTKDSA